MKSKIFLSFITYFILGIFITTNFSYSSVDDCGEDPAASGTVGHTQYIEVFNNIGLYVDPILINGDPFVDWESIGGDKDLTSGANPGGDTDISGGCTTSGAGTCPDSNCNPNCTELADPNNACPPPTNESNSCGLDPSGWFGFFDPDLNLTVPTSPTGGCNGTDGAGDGNEFVLFRMRLNGNPLSGSGVFRNAFWHFLMDIPLNTAGFMRGSDGWNDIFVEINSGDTANSADVVKVFFNDGVNAATPTQSCITPTDCSLSDGLPPYNSTSI